MHNVINENMAEKTFINNNTFLGSLHSRGVVQHFHLEFQDNMHLFQPPRWCDITLPNLGPNFPHAGFFVVPKTFLNTKSPGASGLSFTLAS